MNSYRKCNASIRRLTCINRLLVMISRLSNNRFHFILPKQCQHNIVWSVIYIDRRQSLDICHVSASWDLLSSHGTRQSTILLSSSVIWCSWYRQGPLDLGTQTLLDSSSGVAWNRPQREEGPQKTDWYYRITSSKLISDASQQGGSQAKILWGLCG